MRERQGLDETERETGRQTDMKTERDKGQRRRDTESETER